MTRKWRIWIGVCTCGIAVLAAWKGRFLVHASPSAVDVLVTVFSILAGFLVAIIAIVGDPALLPTRNWRSVSVRSRSISSQLTRYKWLFYLYLFTLGGIFLARLLESNFPQVTCWLEYIYLFFGVWAFELSLFLPNTLTKIHEKKIDEAVREQSKIDKKMPGDLAAE